MNNGHRVYESNVAKKSGRAVYEKFSSTIPSVRSTVMATITCARELEFLTRLNYGESSFMIEVGIMRYAGGSMLALLLAFLAGCSPVYLWETHTTSTPRPQSFDVAVLTREPVATLGPLTPAGLQGLSPFLSRGLIAAISQASPSIRAIPNHETLNAINGQGLAAEYADLISGFARSGILERERLQLIGSALGSRHVLLPGLADFNQVLVDKFEVAGIKVVTNRVITLRLWLQLWDAQTGQIVWESTGEAIVVSELILPERIVPLDEIGQKLWLRMIQDRLVGGEDQVTIYLQQLKERRFK
jgi:hypothetical protein